MKQYCRPKKFGNVKFQYKHTDGLKSFNRILGIKDCHNPNILLRDYNKDNACVDWLELFKASEQTTIGLSPDSDAESKNSASQIVLIKNLFLWDKYFFLTKYIIWDYN